MKTLSAFFFIAALLCGQAPAPAPPPVQDPAIKVTPGTPSVKGPGEAPPAATPPPPVAPDTVVVEVDGKKITAAELDKIIASFPQANQAQLRTQPKFLSQVFMMQKLAEDFEKAGLDKQSPYKEQLNAMRLQFMFNSEMNYVNNTTKVTEEEEHKYYNDHPEKFKEVKVRVIYVAFNPTPGKPAADGKKLPTEAEAKAKIEDLAKQVQGGGDFGKLARENSDDASAGKDGDFGSINPSSSYAQPIKTAVFALKQGEVSMPIKQAGGFYLIRAEEVGLQPFGDVFAAITQAVRTEKFDAFMKAIQAQYNVKVEDPAYFAPRAPAQLQQVH
ncbi:MAG TPA: peptidylprolyl isomerase [Bryobacteraceae bacterium]|jgi:PPIC-type PPIASE domain|nr:peptidylprolyl isomerase [Bryobacteraceae bacterium]